MEFKVTRTSFLLCNPKPCEEAKKQDDAWFVEIDTLEDLLNFTEKHGDIILSCEIPRSVEAEIQGGKILRTVYEAPRVFEIEIYDDYRET